MSTDSEEVKTHNFKKEDRNAKKKLGLDNLHEGFFEETSSSSEDDGVDFQAEELQFSSSGSENDNNSDVDLKSSDEEELLNLYDKKLREKLTCKKTSKKEEESDSNGKMTARIAEYMKKMRTEEKNLASKLNEGKLTKDDIDRNRKTKEAILKKFDYKDQLKKMKNQGMLKRYESTESENETDSEMEEVVSKLEKMTTHPAKKAKAKSNNAKEYDIKKKIEEMKKMVGSPTSSDQIDEHLLQAKMRVADWMKEEEAKSSALKEKFSASGRFAAETLMRPPVGRKPLKKPDLSRLSEPKNPLPPIKKKNLGETVKGIKKEDVLKILREAEGPTKVKKGNEKDANALKKIIAGPKNPALAKLIQLKNDSGKTPSKSADLTRQSPSASKTTERKPILKKSSFKKSVV